MREEILAGGTNINLRDYSYYFFEVGLRIAKESKEVRDSNELKRTLIKAFTGNRYRQLLVNSLTRFFIFISIFKSIIYSASNVCNFFYSMNNQQSLINLINNLVVGMMMLQNFLKNSLLRRLCFLMKVLFLQIFFFLYLICFYI
jgi:hypothetical protein